MMASKPTSPILPTICLLIAASLWGTSWYPLRLLDAQGLHGIWAAFFIYAGTLVFGLPLFLFRRQACFAHWRYLLLLGLVSGWCNVAFFLAILEGNVVRVLVLFYLSPIWAVILARFVLHEVLSGLAKLSLAIAMCGALIMLWSPAVGLPWPQTQADWLAISSGFAFALGNVITRQGERVPILAKTLSTWFGAVAVGGLWIVLSSSSLPEVSQTTLLAALGLGAGAIVIMTALVQYGVTNMPVHRSAVVLLFELFAGAVSAQLLTNEIVTLQEWLGGVLILLAAGLSARLPALNPDFPLTSTAAAQRTESAREKKKNSLSP